MIQKEMEEYCQEEDKGGMSSKQTNGNKSPLPTRISARPPISQSPRKRKGFTREQEEQVATYFADHIAL